MIGGSTTSAVYLVLLIAALGAVGAITILMLLATWRRHNARMAALRERYGKPADETRPDAWSAAAERLEVDGPRTREYLQELRDTGDQPGEEPPFDHDEDEGEEDDDEVDDEDDDEFDDTGDEPWDEGDGGRKPFGR